MKTAEEKRAADRARYAANRDKKLAADRAWYAANRDKKLAAVRACRAANPEKARAAVRACRAANPEKARANGRAWQVRPIGRLRQNLRRRFRYLLNRGHPGRRDAVHLDLVGCTRAHLIVHIESQWAVGMTWANYGVAWQVDHIRPIWTFDLTDPDQQRAAFHWTNTQPLTPAGNQKKAARDLVLWSHVRATRSSPQAAGS